LREVCKTLIGRISILRNESDAKQFQHKHVTITGSLSQKHAYGDRLGYLEQLNHILNL
jgi:hypothetical protein